MTSKTTVGRVDGIVGECPPRARASRLERVALGLTVLLFVGFGFYCIRGLVQPEIVSARFGVSVEDTIDMLYFRVYLSRNISLLLSGLAFLVFGMRRPLAIVVTLIAALPVVDMGLIMAHFNDPSRVAFHAAVLGPLALTAALLWISARKADNATTA